MTCPLLNSSVTPGHPIATLRAMGTDDSDFQDDYRSDFPSDSAGGQPSSPPIEIPLEAVSPDALVGIIDNFVTREGTDYGANEVGHEAKLERVRKQLERGDVKIVFDPDSESVNLMTAADWAKVQSNAQA